MDYFFILLSGSLSASIVAGIFKIFEIKMHQKNGNRQIESSCMKEMKTSIHALTIANRSLLHYRIKRSSLKFIGLAYIPYDDRRDLLEMYNIYHTSLGGNGDLTSLIDDVKKLPFEKAGVTYNETS